ncbi:MAG: S9 family peptidase [Candidatus Krumholzibacteriota bacterium]|nr:S9 family peptidase [Candidatus Krumholzibacteriota bacterium]
MSGKSARPGFGKIVLRGLLLLFTLSLAAVTLADAGKITVPRPPVTRKDNVVDTLHGIEIVDPYRWLEDQESAETRAWIKAENEYTHSILDQLPGRKELVERLTALMKIDRIGIPTVRGNRYFLSRRSADQDQFVIYMREGLEGKDVVLIDPNSMSEDQSSSVDMLDVSRDGSLLAYGIREGGQDELTVRLFNVDKKEDLPDQLPKGLYFGISIMPDNSGFYYSLHNPLSGSRVYFHKIGSDMADDEEIFGEGFGAGIGIGAGLSEDGRYLGILVFHGSAGEKVEIYYKDLSENGPVKTVVNDIDANFFPEIIGDKAYIQTNWNAPNGKIMVADMSDPAPKNWKEVIPESDRVLEGFSLVGGKLCLRYLDNVVSRVDICEPDGKFIRQISFPTLGSVSGIAGNWDRNEAFFVFSSFHVPTTIYRYDMVEGKQQIWAKLDVPVDTETIAVDQVWYESKDGTKIPMFLVHSKGIKLDGDNPVLMTSYGGFNVSLTPRFSALGVLWVERGGIFAMPNLRGGGEFGEKWHKAGIREKKQNVFDDFIAAAEWLIDNKYTSPSRLAISGGSNGGLLVGAVENQRPELYKAVVCTYPLLDMLRYHKFMLGRFWVPEYGSADDPEQFKYIHAYSPYHNVKKGTKYPATLYISGDSDTRVAPLHIRKMTALMHENNGSDNPILLLYDTKAGHSGGTPVSKQIEDDADRVIFLLWQLGML